MDIKKLKRLIKANPYTGIPQYSPPQLQLTEENMVDPSTAVAPNEYTNVKFPSGRNRGSFVPQLNPPYQFIEDKGDSTLGGSPDWRAKQAHTARSLAELIGMEEQSQQNINPSGHGGGEVTRGKYGVSWPPTHPDYVDPKEYRAIDLVGQEKSDELKKLAHAITGTSRVGENGYGDGISSSLDSHGPTMGSMDNPTNDSPTGGAGSSGINSTSSPSMGAQTPSSGNSGKPTGFRVGNETPRTMAAMGKDPQQVVQEQRQQAMMQQRQQQMAEAKKIQQEQEKARKESMDAQLEASKQVELAQLEAKHAELKAQAIAQQSQMGQSMGQPQMSHGPNYLGEGGYGASQQMPSMAFGKSNPMEEFVHRFSNDNESKKTQSYIEPTRNNLGLTELEMAERNVYDSHNGIIDYRVINNIPVNLSRYGQQRPFSFNPEELSPVEDKLDTIMRELEELRQNR